MALSLVAYLLVRSASDSSQAVRYFSSILAKVCAFLRLEVVKLFVRHASHTRSQHLLQQMLQGNENSVFAR